MSESARFNMVEAQIRSANVTDQRILAAMNAVPREKFVPSASRALAYADVPVAVAQGRYLLDPRSFAKLAAAGRHQPRATGYWMWAAAPAIPPPFWRGWEPRWWRWSRMPIWYVLPVSYWRMLWARLKWCRAG